MITEAMVIHYIDDMDDSLTFYKTALGLEATTESSGWSTLRVNDGLELALHTRVDSAGKTGTGAHPFDEGETTLVLTVDDLRAYCNRIRSHGGSLDRIIEPHENVPIRMGLVRDPSGNGFQVNQYVG